MKANQESTSNFKELAKDAKRKWPAKEREAQIVNKKEQNRFGAT